MSIRFHVIKLPGFLGGMLKAFLRIIKKAQ